MPAGADLATGEAIFRRSFESALVGMCMTRTDGRFLRVNPVFARLLGHVIDIAADGRQACEALQRTGYDVVLMDVHMPVMDGLEATAPSAPTSTPTSPGSSP